MPYLPLKDECYTIDFPVGFTRITHHPSGATCQRRDWMQGPDTLTWQAMLEQFFARFPNCSLVVNNRREIIDDTLNFPIRGGGFRVGDMVVTRERGWRDANCARQIVASAPNGNPLARNWGEVAEDFILEDGTMLRWAPESDAWHTQDKDGVVTTRARKPLPDEDISAILYDTDDMLADAARIIIPILQKLPGDWRPWHLLKDHQDVQFEIRRQIDALGGRLDQGRYILKLVAQNRARGWASPDHPERPEVTLATARALEETVALAERFWNWPGAVEAGMRNSVMGFDTILLRGGAVVDTMRARGVLPSLAEVAAEATHEAPGARLSP